MNWLRDRFGRGAVRESVSEALEAPTTKQVRRAGFEYGIPLNVSPSSQVASTSERQQILNQLHQAYLTCIWVSSPIDLIARTVTAGGVQIVSDEDIPEGEVPPDPPPIQRLRRLLRFVNPHEDMVQLLRNVATDLLLFGDAFLETVTLLGEPVALYTLDATTITVISDEHGEVTGYQQDIDGMRQARFTPEQVIHISLDAPRGGLYGVSPAQKALLPVTAWLFWEATLKETGRRGDPPRVHVDLAHLQDADVQRWREQYAVNNLGPKAVGAPVVTTGGGAVQVLDPRKVTDYLDATRQLRDEIIACFGCPPAKLGIIESGNLGSGSGESQDKTFRVNTIIPIANLILEKLNYHLLQAGFGITDFHLEFSEIDYRDSKIVEEIRDMRLRNGAYTLNRYRDEIGEPPVDGGDDPIILDRLGPVPWQDVPALSRATIAWRTAPLTAAGVNGYVPGVPDADLDPTPDPTAPVPHKPAQPQSPEDKPGLAGDATQGDPPEETWDDVYRRCLDEALARL
ncbi:phage portal protein [Streptomyces olivoverticillatus]|uniref:phage portal protein n=1 Tax=Streptomyces olivoverticillatus TaxID=66427 RepID=UPI0016133A16|nr:phage portal protein [Streptomyces olivoverticillatus]